MCITLVNSLFLAVTVPEIGADPYEIAVELFNVYGPILAVFSGYGVAIGLLAYVASYFVKLIQKI